MSAHVESWAWDQNVTPVRKLILVKLASMANDDGYVLLPISQEELARQIGARRETVNQHLRALVGERLLDKALREGHKSTLEYRLMVPWADGGVRNTHTRAGVVETHDAVGDSHNGVSESHSPPTPPSKEDLSPKDLAAGAAREVTFLGQRRWKVESSRAGRGPFTVDLAAERCTCENHSGNPCTHMRAARKAEQQMGTARRRELREAVWDKLTEIFGPPTTRGSGDRGMIVADVVELLVGDKVPETPERYAQEVQKRYEALAHDWGVGKATIHSLHKNWVVAGKLAGGVAVSGSGSENGGDGLPDYN